MKRFTLLLMLALALAGCAEDSGPADETPDDDSETPATPTTGNQTQNPITLSCTSTVGAVGVSFSSNGVNVGGCPLGDTTGTMQVVSVTPGASCSIEADLDGDSLADEEVTAGKTYESGVSLTAFCSPPGIDEVNTVELISV